MTYDSLMTIKAVEKILPW